MQGTLNCTDCTAWQASTQAHETCRCALAAAGGRPSAGGKGLARARAGCDGSSGLSRSSKFPPRPVFFSCADARAEEAVTAGAQARAAAEE